MSPAVMVTDSKPTMQSADMLRSSSAHSSTTHSPAAATSSSLVDLPDQLDDCVKETFLVGFSSAAMHSAMRDVNTIREAVLGMDRVMSLISDGCSPEMIGSMIGSKQELLDGFKSVEGDVRDLALGYAVVQVATQYSTASLGDDPSLDSVRLRRFQTMLQGMKADAPTKTVEFPKIDYSAVVKYVQDEKHNGSLVGDPAWEDVPTRKLKKMATWGERLQTSLEELNRDFRQAADVVDWTVTSQMDTDVLEAMPASALISLILTSYDRVAVRLAAGPPPPGQSSPVMDAENLSRLGSDFRSDALDYCKRIANEAFTVGRYQDAEQLYDIALRAGSNDATVPINRAAALLNMDRFDEAQQCCTLGLLQLDVAGQAESKEKESLHGSKTQSLRSCQRSRPMLASRETMEELRWKALVRRGRARKGILMRLGGLSPYGAMASSQAQAVQSSDSHEGEEEEEDDEEEHRRAEERGRVLLAARSDFAAALRIDPLDSISRQEMASLSIDPLQRRPSGQDISKGLALASISQLDTQRKRSSQEAPVLARPRRSESS